MSFERMQTNGESARNRAAFTRSKAGLNRCGHAAEKAAGQAVVIPQDEGEGPYETAQAHGRDITIPILSRNEGVMPVSLHVMPGLVRGIHAFMRLATNIDGPGIGERSDAVL